MKPVTVLLLPLLVASLLACCRDMPPLCGDATEPEAVLGKSAPLPASGNLPLSGSLRVSGSRFACRIAVHGSIIYTMTTFPQNGYYRVGLRLASCARLSPEAEEKGVWCGRCVSYQEVIVSEEGMAIAEHCINVMTPRGCLKLHARLLVTVGGIGLNGLWL